jgi:hypothetical protein
VKAEKGLQDDLEGHPKAIEQRMQSDSYWFVIVELHEVAITMALCCPASLASWKWHGAGENGSEVVFGYLVQDSGRKYLSRHDA